MDSGPFRVAVRCRGPGSGGNDPVVLVHGMLASSRYLRPTLDHLAVSHPAIAPDLPGAGGTAAPERPLSIAENAEVLRDVMATLTGPAIVVGHSTGSLVATELAVRYPELAQRLVLVSPVIAPDQRTPRTASLNWARAMVHEPTRFLARSLGDVVTTGFAKSRADLRNTLAYRLEDTIRQIRCPALVVRGDRDPLVPATWARAVADLAHATTDADYREVPGWHAVPYTSPAALADAVRGQGTPGRDTSPAGSAASRPARRARDTGHGPRQRPTT